MSMGSGGTPDVPWEDGEPQAPTYDLSVALPTGAVAQHGLAIASFFDAEGNTRYALTLDGASSLSAILGLLELVKARVLKEAEEW